MNPTLRKNLLWYTCGGLGVLHFILMAIPYIAVFAKWGSYSQSEGASGYRVMDLWDLGFGGVMSSLTQILILIVAVALLFIGAAGLLKNYNVCDLTAPFANIGMKKIGQYGLYAYAGLHLLLFIFLIIFTASNTESYGGMSGGFRFAIGFFITLAVAIGAVVTLYLLEKKYPESDDAPSVAYQCGQCGKKVKGSVKFCPDCGGAVVEVAVQPKPKYACSACGAKSAAGTKFCPQCGGAVVEVVAQPKPEYVCSVCGAKGDADSKFCANCGGQVVLK